MAKTEAREMTLDGALIIIGETLQRHAGSHYEVTAVEEPLGGFVATFTSGRHEGYDFWGSGDSQTEALREVAEMILEFYGDSI